MYICVRVYWAGEASVSHGMISHGVNVELRRQTVFSFIMWVHGTELVHQVWQQVPLLAEKYPWPSYEYMDVTIIEMIESVFLLLQVDPNSGHSMSKLVSK